MTERRRIRGDSNGYIPATQIGLDDMGRGYRVVNVTKVLAQLLRSDDGGRFLAWDKRDGLVWLR